MAKCIRLYSNGYTQLTKSESGFWFKRNYEKTPYGYAWTKWEHLGNLKKVNRSITTFENLNGNEIKEHHLHFHFSTTEPEVIYNFSCYFKLKDKRNVVECKYRLPY